LNRQIIGKSICIQTISFKLGHNLLLLLLLQMMMMMMMLMM
jgi:hypothetical protein